MTTTEILERAGVDLAPITTREWPVLSTVLAVLITEEGERPLIGVADDGDPAAVDGAVRKLIARYLTGL